ncbi:alpha/beta hydrolase [Paenibacillus puerhi]|uniref:alpha/beta hydrolase n=1 Tax=Paenibacillus puerhi TaxID=2692622 RepID=UPI0013592CD1|nr:alpha/beta hydrolase [Paenibacillus puerhi]
MFFSSHGYPMYYEWSVNENPEAKTIVLLHGAGLSSAIWQPVTRYLTSLYSILAYDLAGHGQSGDDTRPLSFEAMAKDLHLLVRSLGQQRVVLVAHDTGACIAERYAALYPAELECVVMLAPVWPIPLASIQQQLLAKLNQLERAASMKEYATLLIPSLSAVLPEAGGDVYRGVQAAIARVAKDLYRRLVELSASDTGMPMPASFQRPLLLIAGELDPFFPPVLAHLIAQLVGAASVLILPDASNLVFADQPLYTADFIHRFIQRQTSETIRKANPIELELRSTFRSYWEDRQPHEVTKRQHLRIRCVGTFEVSVGNRMIQQGWNTRHAKSLLIYLAFHRSATREQLCDALFSEKDSPKAMSNLRVYLSHFAKLLESAESDIPCVTIERDTVKLNYEVDCDLIGLLKQLHFAMDMGDNAYRHSMCQLLLEKLQGNILPGCYDPFSLQQKETIEHLWEILSLWAADYTCRQGLYAEAVSFLHSGLQYCTGDELQFYDRLIEIYRRTGNGKELRKWKRMRDKSV